MHLFAACNSAQSFFYKKILAAVLVSPITHLKQKSLQALLSAFPCVIENTVVLVGAARSGTTWLAEILRTLPGYKYLNEPLHQKRNPGAARAGLDWRPFLDPNDDPLPAAEAYVDWALTGRIVGDWHLSASSRVGRLFEHAKQRRLLVKFVRAGRMLQWISKNFEIRGMVFIVRHPCAVVSSMIEHGAWSSMNPTGDTLVDYLGGSVPPALEEDIRARVSVLPRTRVEQLALLWALDHYVPFHYFGSHGYPWTLVPYEALLQDGPDEIERIFEALNSEVPKSAHDHLVEASGSASQDLQVDNTHRQLFKWKRALEPEQVNSIIRIAHAFDLDFYTESVEPDYDLLFQYQ